MEGQRNPLENSIVFSVTLSSFGTSRKVKESMIGTIDTDEIPSEAPIQTDADKKLLKVSKKIFASNSTDQIKNLYGDIRSHLARYTIVGAMFRSGLYLTPHDHVTTVEAYLLDKIRELEYWKFQLGEEYEGVKNEFRAQLGALYNEADYPTVQEVQAKYAIEYEMLAINVPAALEQIDREAFRRANEQAEQRIRIVSDRIEQILTASMQDLIDHLVERLTDTDDGKRKKFATNMLDKARDFFDTFRTRNLTGAEGLNDLAQQGIDLLQGVDLDSLKDQAGMRERVRAGFEAIKTNMAAMITVAPRRAINLGPSSTEQPNVNEPSTSDSDVNPYVESIMPMASAQYQPAVDLGLAAVREMEEGDTLALF